MNRRHLPTRPGRITIETRPAPLGGYLEPAIWALAGCAAAAVAAAIGWL